MNLRESIKKILREQVNKKDIVVYHGTPEKHEFNKKGETFNGTFFSTHFDTSWQYGKYIYRIQLREDLKLIDTNLYSVCKTIIDNFGPLIDPYYDPEEYEHEITHPNQLWDNPDNWSIIEGNEDVMRWLEGNYDGVWIYEGGQRNLLLFNPVNDKITNVTLLTKN